MGSPIWLSWREKSSLNKKTLFGLSKCKPWRENSSRVKCNGQCSSSFLIFSPLLSKPIHSSRCGLLKCIPTLLCISFLLYNKKVFRNLFPSLRRKHCQSLSAVLDCGESSSFLNLLLACYVLISLLSLVFLLSDSAGFPQLSLHLPFSFKETPKWK